VPRDSALIQSAGPAWRVIGGYLTPHTCTMYRNPAQTVSINTATKILCNGSSGDVGGLADTANGHMVVRRGGDYLTTFAMTWYDDFSSFIYNFQIWVYVNGNRIGAGNLYVPETTTRKYGQVNLLGSEKLTLAAGDTVAIYCLQDAKSPWNTRTGAFERARISMTEVR